MAWDKVTKIDSIAKRKAWSKVHQGVLVEYDKAFGRVPAHELCRDTAAQLTVAIGRSGKMRRDMNHGCGKIGTSWPKNHKTS
jgi:hypothetical protein